MCVKLPSRPDVVLLISKLPGGGGSLECRAFMFSSLRQADHMRRGVAMRFQHQLRQWQQQFSTCSFTRRQPLKRGRRTRVKHFNRKLKPQASSPL